MAYISHTTVALHNELAEIQDRRGDGGGIPTLTDLRDLLTALIETSPEIGSARVTAVGTDAVTVTLYGECRITDAPSPERDDK